MGNPERTFGRPEKIDTTPRQSYTDKRDIFMAEQGEGPKPPEQSKISEAEKVNAPSKEPKEKPQASSSPKGEKKPVIKLGKAIWRNKDNDRPIRVTGYWGKGTDGREYVKTDLGPGGVPLDEITFPEKETAKVTKERSEYKKSLKETAQKTWGEWKEKAKGRGGYPGTPEYEKGIQTLINAGKLPLNSEDAKVQQIADAFNRELALHAQGKIKPEYLTSLIDIALKYKHDPGVKTEAADKLIAELQAKRREAEKKSPTRTAKVEGLSGKETPDELRELLKKAGFKEDFLKSLSDEVLNEIAKGASGKGSLPKDSYGEYRGFYLQPKDLEILNKDPMEWLEKQFDTLYTVADQGQELNSPVVSNIQTVWTEAIRYLQDRNPPVLGDFSNVFLWRLNSIFARSAIEHRSIESAKEMSARLLAHGLLKSLTLENGRVYRMYVELNDLLESRRLAQGGKEFHVNAEMIAHLQDDLIEKQFELSKKGFGAYAKDYERIKELYKNDKDDAREGNVRKDVEKQITRAVRTAYDAFVVSQRQAIIVARGRNLTTGERYLSDPIGIFNVYNYEDLLFGKFLIVNREDREFLDELKLEIAKSKLPRLGVDPTKLEREELLDYGRRMIRDLGGVNDFYGSGWRIDGFIKEISERIEYERKIDPKRITNNAEDFALFMRLKKARAKIDKEDERKPHDQLKYELRGDLWNRIAEVRPEEIARLYRERAQGDKLLEEHLKSFFKGSAFDGFRVDESGGTFDAFKTYDTFKQEYGPLINFIRQQGYDDLRALRIGVAGFVFTQAEREAIVRYFDGDETKIAQFQVMFVQMTTAAKSSGVIDQLMKNNRFEDSYTRVQVVDDALLNMAEDPPDKRLTPVSKYWSSEVGGDGLVRNFNDTEHAIKAFNSFLKFIKTEDPKERSSAAIQFAEEASIYGGQDVRVEGVRYTLGSYLNIAKQDFIWDVLGVKTLPLRKTQSRLQEIYGPQAKPLSRDELRHQADELRILMTSSDENKEKAEEIYHEFERLVEITSGDKMKMLALQAIIFIFIAALSEEVRIIREAGKQAA